MRGTHANLIRLVVRRYTTTAIPILRQVTTRSKLSSRNPQTCVSQRAPERTMLKRSFGHEDEDLEEAVVEDSEPEREESRKRRKEEKRKRRDEQKTTVVQEVIELTDSDSPNSPIVVKTTEIKSTEASVHESVLKENRLGGAALPSSTSLINALDNSDLSFPEIIPIISRTDSGKVAAKAGIQRNESMQTIILTSSDGDNNSDSELEETSQNMRSKIGRYAFSISSQGSSIAGRSFKAMSVLPDVPKPMPSSSKNVDSISSSYLNFTEHQLKSVLKCVSCDLKWTIRKTAAPKVAHMRSCSKKTCMTDETMRILISRELKANSAAKQGPKTRVDQEPAQEQPPKTFLEQVVKGSDVQRAGKRQKKALDATVRVVTETRNEILERARLFLNNPSLSRVARESGAPKATKAFGQSDLNNRTPLFPSNRDTNAEPPLTQPLPRSGLGVKMAGPSMLGLMDDPPSDPDEPPPTQEIEPPLTQPIPISGLGAKMGGPSMLGLMDDPPSDFDEPPLKQEISTSKLASLNHNDPGLLGHDSSMDLVSPYHAPLLDLTNNSEGEKEIIYIQDTSVDYNFGDDDAGYDSAVIRFEPDEYGHLIPDENPIQENRLSIPNSSQIDAGDSLASTSGLRKLLDSKICFPIQKDVKKKAKKAKLAVDSETQTKSPRKRKTKSKDEAENSDEGLIKVVISDEEFSEKLLNTLLKDTSIYLRILRYEPIHFEVFLEMVTEHIIDHNLKDGALRLKLRTFLDKHAVHYYGSEPGGSRNRR